MRAFCINQRFSLLYMKKCLTIREFSDIISVAGVKPEDAEVSELADEQD